MADDENNTTTTTPMGANAKQPELHENLTPGENRPDWTDVQGMTEARAAQREAAMQRKLESRDTAKSEAVDPPEGGGNMERAKQQVREAGLKKDAPVTDTSIDRNE